MKADHCLQNLCGLVVTEVYVREFSALFKARSLGSISLLKYPSVAIEFMRNPQIWVPSYLPSPLSCHTSVLWLFIHQDSFSSWNRLGYLLTPGLHLLSLLPEAIPPTPISRFFICYCF